MRLITQIRKKRVRTPLKDISAGLVVALVSIPISMGYAQIAGLASVYGLYGSFLPILVYALLTTSPQFVVGVDAMPAAMVGGLLAALGITAESEAAYNIVPLVSVMTALWFLFFCLVKAGRIVKYISTPVMGGFISGVGITIILMQVPKLFGGTAGTGEVVELLENIAEQVPENFNMLSLMLGIFTIAAVFVGKRFIPKIPMTVVMMAVGALLQVFIGLDNYGVKLLPEVASGLPKFVVPDFGVIAEHGGMLVLESLSIAAVIMAQTLLATGKYASQYGDEIDNNAELLAYAGMNIASAAVGCCPINGSVSRSKIADSEGARSQLMSISAGIFMVIVLIFGTPLLKYLPVPVLTAIVMTALMGIVDVDLFKRLWKESRSESFIFLVSMVAVLVLGTVNGVIAGCIISFWEVAVKSVAPPVCFVGRIPGHGNFHSLERNSHARPICNTVIYRFSGNLFFANIDKFENDIEKAIKPDTKQVVVDARGIGSIDITAVDRLIAFNKKMRRNGIKFYITEHASSLNDNIRAMGGASLIEEGVARITITLALRDAGLHKPYTLEGEDAAQQSGYSESEEKLAEFEWAFGSEAEERLEKLAQMTADDMAKEITEGTEDNIDEIEENGAITQWGKLGFYDEQDFWDILEARIEQLFEKKAIDRADMMKLKEKIAHRRNKVRRRLSEMNPKAAEMLQEHRHRIKQHLKEHDPELFEHLLQHNFFEENDSTKG